MRTLALVAFALSCALFAIFSLVSDWNARHQYNTEVLPWPTVPSLPVQPRWLDSDGRLDSQLLLRFVKKYSKVTGNSLENTEEITTIKPIQTSVQPTPQWKIQSISSVTLTPPCPAGPIITTEDGGRLGNKAWQYAAVWSLSKLLGRPGYVPENMLNYLSHVFANLSLQTLESISHCNLILSEPIKRYKLLPFKLIPQKFNNNNNQNLLLHKWMMLPDPVIMYKKELIKEFTFLPFLLNYVREKFKIISKIFKHFKNKTYVGVHVRRTDFKIWLPEKHNKTLVTAEYFLDAMTWFRKKLQGFSPIFLIFSDDPTWCKNEIVKHAINDSILVSDIRNKVPSFDLALLSFCNHTVIDYGTFGELGALLAGGHTVSLGVDDYFNSVVKEHLKWNIWNTKTHTQIN